MHYFVLLFLVCNVVGFVLAHFIFKPQYYNYFGASLFFIELLILILWMIGQARIKLPTNNFRAQALTFLIYIACVSLIGSSLMAFPKFINKKRAALVDPVQLKADKDILESYKEARQEREFTNNGYKPIESPEEKYQDDIEEMLTRYYWMDKEEVFRQMKVNPFGLSAISEEITRIEIAGNSNKSNSSRCETYAKIYGGLNLVTNLSERNQYASDQLGYVKCRLGYGIVLIMFLFLAAQMKFRAWLGIVFLHLGVSLFTIHIGELYFLLLGIRSFEALISVMVMHSSPIIEIILALSLIAVFCIRKNNKLRRFLVFFCLSCVPIATLNLVFQLFSLTDFSFNTLEYFTKVLFILIPAIVASSTYLIVKKNANPPIK